MKAISLHQPWASLWLTSRKVHETRSWSTKHRGPLFVHASKQLEFVRGELLDIVVSEFGAKWASELPTGALIGTVDLYDCIPTNLVLGVFDSDYICGDWSRGRFAWQRTASFQHFRNPVPYRGRQGLFNVPDAVIA